MLGVRSPGKPCLFLKRGAESANSPPRKPTHRYQPTDPQQTPARPSHTPLAVLISCGSQCPHRPLPTEWPLALSVLSLHQPTHGRWDANCNRLAVAAPWLDSALEKLTASCCIISPRPPSPFLALVRRRITIPRRWRGAIPFRAGPRQFQGQSARLNPTERLFPPLTGPDAMHSLGTQQFETRTSGKAPSATHGQSKRDHRQGRNRAARRTEIQVSALHSAAHSAQA